MLVGESPPPGAAPDFRPFDCNSGDRLVHCLGLRSRALLLEHVPRCNIFDQPGVGLPGGPRWSQEVAAHRGLVIRKSAQDGGMTIVALGRWPAIAIGLPKEPPWCSWHRVDGVDIIAAPHPSGRSSTLNTTAGQTMVRRALLPEIMAGCPGLRPWHFDLDRVEVLADLGAAVSPLDPALGVAALRIADEVHRAKAAPNKHWSLDSFHQAVDFGMRLLVRGCSRGVDGAADELGRIPRAAADLRARSKAAAQSIARDYPVEVLRATVGRYFALGVL